MDELLCPACGGDQPEVLGQLGRLAWFRCIYCGAEFSKEMRLESEDEDETPEDSGGVES